MKKLGKLKLKNAVLMNENEMKNVKGGYGGNGCDLHATGLQCSGDCFDLGRPGYCSLHFYTIGQPPYPSLGYACACFIS